MTGLLGVPALPLLDLGGKGTSIMNSHDLSAAMWIKSSHSGANGGDCIEVAPGFRTVVPVRDSKTPDGPVLLLSRTAWAAFTSTVR
ncbi:hypothetical protein GCM10022232_54910 [Streptomyces plumbiresistens]|uniref:DUF397 domain-containing protein n=2 Tax=Streptomyces plumbiresistens TaxID=511811 RepID=A0ABP7S7F5_9ACTN